MYLCLANSFNRLSAFFVCFDCCYFTCRFVFCNSQETRVRFETTRNSLLVLFTDYFTVLHTFDTFCRKFNLFIVNNFDSVLQLSIGKLCSSNSVW